MLTLREREGGKEREREGGKERERERLNLTYALLILHPLNL
jgi:hypothetical protein